MVISICLLVGDGTVYTVDDFVLGLLTLEFYTHSVLMKKLNPTMHRISYCVDEVTVTPTTELSLTAELLR
jgi:hypothetical protein